MNTNVNSELLVLSWLKNKITFYISCDFLFQIEPRIRKRLYRSCRLTCETRAIGNKGIWSIAITHLGTVTIARSVFGKLLLKENIYR